MAAIPTVTKRPERIELVGVEFPDSVMADCRPFVIEVGRRIDRKFHDGDVISAESNGRNPLVQAALDFLREYSGSFEYLVDMKDKVRFGLSNRQVAGVLNCLMAEARRSQPVAAPATSSDREEVFAAPAPRGQPQVAGEPLPDGTYTLELTDGGHRTIRLVTVEQGR